MCRRTTVRLALLALLVCPAGALALTTPMTGASAFPSTGETLRLPFPAGSRVRVSSGYSPSGGSSLHNNIDVSSFGNDYYALDLVYDGEPSGGLGMPLVAALSGTVVRAGWATAGWSNFGQRVILRHDLGDGHVYHTLYAHLNAIDPAIVEGATVRQGDVLGELGGSCMGALSCSSFSGPHIHFSVHRNSMVGGSGTGGSYGGNAVVPEPIDGAEDLTRGQIIVSMNTGGPSVCGDGFCAGDESSETCPADCPVCVSIPPAGRAVDESEDLCFTRGGDPSYWREEPDGHEASLIWTHATDATAVDNHGIWSLRFDEAGTYLVEAYTDGDWAQAQMAAYRVTHDGSTDVVRLDQSAADGWQSLGEHRFAAGGAQSVRLDDNTGEAFSLRRQIVFDGIRLSRVDVTPGTDAGVGRDGGGAADGGAASLDAGPSRTDGGAISSDGGTTAIPDGGGRPLGTEGCGCRVAASDTPSPLFALLLLPWLMRRRSR